jgi:sulfonate transport system ATP-binding protein
MKEVFRDSPAQETLRGTAVVAVEVQRRFNGRDVLKNVNLTIKSDQFVALLGRSGSGKSTLLRILGGLDADYEGDVLVPERRAVVFQEARLIPWLRVLPNVVLGLGLGDSGRTALRDRGLDALREVELEEHAHDWPLTLSGGEAQRVALARALVREPQLMLLDEPFGALDALTRIKMQSLLQRLCALHQPAVLLVTHDVDEAILLADRVTELVDGTISLDVEVDIERPRNRGDARFVAMRDRLLRELGVDEQAPPPPPVVVLAPRRFDSVKRTMTANRSVAHEATSLRKRDTTGEE